MTTAAAAIQTTTMREVNALVFSQLAQQLRAERDARQAKLDSATPGWRNTAPTWQQWGADSLKASTAAAAVSGGDGEEDDKKEQKKNTTSRGPPPPPSGALKPAYDLIFDRFDVLLALNSSAAQAEDDASFYSANVSSSTQKKRITINHADLSSNDRDDDDVERSTQEIKGYMFSRREEPSQFHVVHLDLTTLQHTAPLLYAPLDSAVQCVANRGLVSIAAPVSAVLRLAGLAPSSASSSSSAFDAELACRLVLANLERHANRNSKFAVPLLMTSTAAAAPDVVLVYARVYAGSLKEVNRSVLRVGNLFQCAELGGAFRLVPLSSETARTTTANNANNTKVALTGVSPKDFGFAGLRAEWTLCASQVWAYAVHNAQFVTAVAVGGDVERELKELNGGGAAAAAGETDKTALVYSLAELQRAFGASSSSLSDVEPLVYALRHAGFVASASSSSSSFKTDAPSQAVAEVVRHWLAAHPPTASASASTATATAARFLKDTTTAATLHVPTADFTPTSNPNKRVKVDQ